MLDRQLWFLTKLMDLLTQYHVAVLAFEEFSALPPSGNAEHGDVAQWPLMHRLIGGIQALALAPPYPVLMPLAPGRWEARLTARAHPSRHLVALTINQRLGTRFAYDHYSNHAVDAAGLALTALDIMQATQAAVRLQGQAGCVPRRRA
jgi:hypothetical protein